MGSCFGLSTAAAGPIWYDQAYLQASDSLDCSNQHELLLSREFLRTGLSHTPGGHHDAGWVTRTCLRSPFRRARRRIPSIGDDGDISTGRGRRGRSLFIGESVRRRQHNPDVSTLALWPCLADCYQQAPGWCGRDVRSAERRKPTSGSLGTDTGIVFVSMPTISLGSLIAGSSSPETSPSGMARGPDWGHGPEDRLSSE